MNAQPDAQIERHDEKPRRDVSQATRRAAKVSPRSQSRMAGVIALITTTAGFAALVSSTLVVPGDAATTAHNILGHETLYRLACAGDVIAILYIAYTLLLYHVFRPVNRGLSLLAACFSLRSIFLPRILGVLLAFSGVCYLINSFATFLSPAFAAHLVPYILIPGLAELLLALWLVVFGVNAARWREQEAAAGERPGKPERPYRSSTSATA